MPSLAEGVTSLSTHPVHARLAYQAAKAKPAQACRLGPGQILENSDRRARPLH